MDTNKWQDISLLSCASKIIISVIVNRLGKSFLGVGLDEKCGGVFQKGCIDGTFNIKQDLYILKHQQNDVWAIFADLEKSYDTVDWPVMWQILRIYSVPDALILVLRKLYSEIFIEPKGYGKNTSIPSTVSVKQGNNLDPILFFFFINAVGESILPEWEQAGIEAPMIQYYKQDYPKYDHHGHSTTTGVRQGEPLRFFKSYYVKNSDFLTISRRDAEKATSLIVKHFHWLGIKIHFGIRSTGKASKT